jgi:hypothetical protein
MLDRFGFKTYIWIKNPWAWQRKPLSLSKTATAAIVAILVNKFPTDAKKTRRLIGLWNDFEIRNVMITKRHPATESPDVTLSITTR